MNTHYTFHEIPPSRLATFDVFAVSKKKHHVAALLEMDVSAARRQLREIKKLGKKVSFTAWVIKSIATALMRHPQAAAFVFNRKKSITFKDVNISLLVEKQVGGKKVPIPLVIEKTNQKDIESITREIEMARSQHLLPGEVLLHRRTGFAEKVYYRLPGLLRRMVWRILLLHPRKAYQKMGNVSVTSPGMAGAINGWFIHASIHPLSVGIGPVIKKPVVVRDDIQVREILNMTVLLDHDALDGAPMARFIRELTRLLESGEMADSHFQMAGENQ